MRCPACQSDDTRVVDSRVARGEVRRRRECQSCGERFTTYEHVEATSLFVRKRSGAVERFERAKLRQAILRSVSKGVPSPEAVEILVEELHRTLATSRSPSIASGIPSGDIARRVIDELAQLDGVASARFAAEYEQSPDGSLSKRTRQTASAKRAASSRQLPLFAPNDDRRSRRQ